MKFIVMYALLSWLLFSSCDNRKNDNSKMAETMKINAIGAMRDAMWKGELYPKISLDTISPKDGLYGMGPLSYMRGEILINNGHSYVSFIDKDSSLKVIETDTVSAPFFVYGHNLNWTSQKLPEWVTDIASLEKFLKGDVKTDHPFVFKISGRISAAKIHVQNLPTGTKVSSPKEAHTGQRSFELQEESVEIIGFYSQHHHGIFTHHDTNLHMHLISADKLKMGHLDALTMRGMTLSIPKSIRVRN